MEKFLIWLISQEGLIELDIPTHRRSKAIHYTGPRLLRFADKNDYSLEEQSPTIEAKVFITKNIQQPLLIFTQDKTGSAQKYKIFVVEDSIERLPGGAAMFINLTPYPLVLLLGESKDKRIELKPSGRRIHKFKDENVNLRVRIASYAEDIVRKGIDTRIFPLSSHRDLYFIYPIEADEPGRVRMRILRENEISAKRANETAQKANSEG